MTFEEYIPLALRTEQSVLKDTSPEFMRFLHGAIGLATEAGELLKGQRRRSWFDHKNLIEELGDLYWNSVLCMDSYKLDISRVELDISEFNLSIDELMEATVIESLEILDIALKTAFRGHAFNKDKATYSLAIIINLLGIIGFKAAQVSPEKVMQANIIKLEKRYKNNNFTVEESLNRNTTNELSHIKEMIEVTKYVAPLINPDTSLPKVERDPNTDDLFDGKDNNN